jgi:Tfp pilus assembly protein PilE
MKKRKVSRVQRRSSGMNRGKLIKIMAIVIVILVLGLIYAFAAKPAFDRYVIKKQNEAQDMVLNALLSQLYQNGYIQIPLANGNVLVLVEYQPNQQQTSQ